VQHERSVCRPVFRGRCLEPSASVEEDRLHPRSAGGVTNSDGNVEDHALVFGALAGNERPNSTKSRRRSTRRTGRIRPAGVENRQGSVVGAHRVLFARRPTGVGGKELVESRLVSSEGAKATLDRNDEIGVITGMGY